MEPTMDSMLSLMTNMPKAPPLEGTYPSRTILLYTQLQSSNLAQSPAVGSCSAYDDSAQSQDFSLPHTILKSLGFFNPYTFPHVSSTAQQARGISSFSPTRMSNSRIIVRLCESASQLLGRWCDQKFVLNDRNDTTRSRDVPALIAKDASVCQVLHADARIQSDGEMAVSGPRNPSEGTTAGALMILAIRHNSVGGSNVVKDVIIVGRWHSRETVVAVPPLTAEQDVRCETICVMQQAGTGGIA